MRRRGAVLAAALAAAAAGACAHPPTRPPPPPEAPRRGEVGLASYYSAALEGRRTASGAPYHGKALTCAHPTLPFGTRLRVTDLESGRTVVVEVTDRGPFAPGRIVDLSWAAARELGMLERGVARVRLEPAE